MRALRPIAAACPFLLASPSLAAAAEFALTSAAFAPEGPVPREHTCDGEDGSPPLAWRGAPAGTKAFALVVDDPDAPAGTWVHWVYYDLPATLTSLPARVPRDDVPTAGGRQGRNDFRRGGYGGPCPPPGKPHRYQFTLYALDAPTGLPPGATKAQVLETIEGHTLGEARLTATYGR